MSNMEGKINSISGEEEKKNLDNNKEMIEEVILEETSGQNQEERMQIVSEKDNPEYSLTIEQLESLIGLIVNSEEEEEKKYLINKLFEITEDEKMCQFFRDFNGENPDEFKDIRFLQHMVNLYKFADIEEDSYDEDTSDDEYLDEDMSEEDFLCEDRVDGDILSDENFDDGDITDEDASEEDSLDQDTLDNGNATRCALCTRREVLRPDNRNQLSNSEYSLSNRYCEHCTGTVKHVNKCIDWLSITTIILIFSLSILVLGWYYRN